MSSTDSPSEDSSSKEVLASNPDQQHLEDRSLPFDEDQGDGLPPGAENGHLTTEVETSIENLDRVTRQLFYQNVVTPEEVTEAVQKQEEGEEEYSTVWRALASVNSVDREQVFQHATDTYAFDCLEDPSDIDPSFVQETLESFPDSVEEDLVEHRVIPCFEARPSGTFTQEDVLVFGAPDPMSKDVREIVSSLDVGHFDLRYLPLQRAEALLTESLHRDNEYLQRIQSDDTVNLGETFEDEDDDLVDEERLEEEISRSTLINLFEAALVEAVRDGASDIHIYPNEEKDVEIHFRINGQLQHWYTEDRLQPEAFLSVVKDNCMSIDRFESDAAQDGFIQRDVDGTRIRFRVSVMPLASTGNDIDAESIVIRVLDDRKVIKDISQLGLGQRALDRFKKAIEQPYGMVILTGPTGSGKSTSLVAALHRVMGPQQNVLTIEDPVEYVINGARQIKLSDKLQLTDALRSVLRHDPDTVMVGEMRDQVTAELAIKLANTGHLTFSTLHTNDAPSAVTRLYKMNIEPFLIAYAINLVVAQRLIRTLCPDCKRPVTSPDTIKLNHMGFSSEDLDSHTLYTAGTGCKTCNGTGYDGRRAIAEALYFTEPIRHMIVDAEDVVDEGAIRKHAQQEDSMLSLQDSARRAVLNGETSVEEMRRVVAS